MKEKRNLHLKVQEMCDCYATADPLKEMSIVKNDEDKEEAALKWLALATLHGINNNDEATPSMSFHGEANPVNTYEITFPNLLPDNEGSLFQRSLCLKL